MVGLYISLAAIALPIVLLFARLAYLLIVPYGPRVKREPNAQCHVAMFLGSGGHTAEMLQLLQALPPQRYTPRTYITAGGDKFSITKAIEAEERIQAQMEREKGMPPNNGSGSSQAFDFVTLPRAREVHQAWLSTPVSFVMAFFACTYHIVLLPLGLVPASRSRSQSGLFADLILMNGPGTCVPIVASVYILRVSRTTRIPRHCSAYADLFDGHPQIFGLRSPRLIYVESFARVRSLSLTAMLVRHFVDKFVVQWNEAVRFGAQFRGWLI